MAASSLRTKPDSAVKADSRIRFAKSSLFPQFKRLPFQGDPGRIAYPRVGVADGAPNLVESAGRERRHVRAATPIRDVVRGLESRT